MPIEELHRVRFICECCNETKYEDRWNSSHALPDGWENRFSPKMHTYWDPYMKQDITEEGYATIICCPSCKNQYMTWEQYRNYYRNKGDNINYG